MTAVMAENTTLRPFADSDYTTWSDVHNAVWPEFPTNEEDLREDDRLLAEGQFMERWVAEWDSSFVGWVSVFHSLEVFDPDRYILSVNVRPEYEGRGVGRRLYDRGMAIVNGRGGKELLARTREDRPRGVRFLEDRGFIEKLRERMSQLDLEDLDFGRWAETEASVARQGIVIRSLRELEADPDRDRKLHELDSRVSMDVPCTKPYTPLTFENYCERVLRSKWLRPDGFLVALDGDLYVGTTALWCSEADEALYTGLTGVLPEFRRRGIATALKVRNLRWARDNGRRFVKTFNERNNRNMLGINEALGFVAQPEFIHYVKVLKN